MEDFRNVFDFKTLETGYKIEPRGVGSAESRKKVMRP